MITIHKVESESITEGEGYVTVEMRGLSTDTKPTTNGDKKIVNGSIFVEIDTGKIFFYDLASETWKEV